MPHAEIKDVTVSEETPGRSKTIVEKIEYQTERELAAVNEIEFNPTNDLAHLDAIIEATRNKIEFLSSIDVLEFLKSEAKTSHEAALQVSGDDPQSITLEDVQEPTISNILRAEKSIAETLQKYQAMLTTCLKERRMLSGQLYGSHSTQGSHATRLVKARQIRLSGDRLLQSFSGAELPVSPEHVPAIDPNAEMPKASATPTDFKTVVDITDYKPKQDFEPHTSVAGEVLSIPSPQADPKVDAAEVVDAEFSDCD